MAKKVRALIFLLALSPTLVWAAVAGRPNPYVVYDAEKDLLTISASQIPLDQLLREIAKKTGVEAKLDAEAEKQVSVNLPEAPLLSALKMLGQDAALNYALVHTPAAGPQKPRKVVFRVLWAGTKSGSSAISGYNTSAPSAPTVVEKPVETPQPAVTVSTPSPTEESPERAIARARIEKRIASLPEEQRIAILQREEERRKKREERDAVRAQRRDMRMNLMQQGGDTAEVRGGMPPVQVQQGGQ